MSLAISFRADNIYTPSCPRDFKKISADAIMSKKVSKMDVKSGTVRCSSSTDKNGLVTLQFPWGTPPDIVRGAIADADAQSKKNAMLIRMRRKLEAKKN